ncbi:aminotransferase class III-fold pyridoxal phosphate-dependent enzyme [Pseudoalteromonas sp. T1lg75]|uniref:aminotransferase class III-fold pyridoxal phosphate-dependent enzyme n=1 Tax=Pseudoalteromonas sp. T1lg75 TaxID=2077102 RepID=UPI000CF6B890|nr:aminotransferase class III-fold pyridoxal phosphate-dependent enzyme [Pseudoalteromonas sp. T1lg75]
MLTLDQITELLKQHYDLMGELTELPGYCDQNLILSYGDTRYVVKVSGNGESVAELEMQNAAMAHLTEKGCAVPHALANRNGALLTPLDINGVTLQMRVLSYLPGNFYATATHGQNSAPLLASLGGFMGQIQNGLNDFDHHGAYRYLDWDLSQGYGICMSKKALLDDDKSKLVERFISLYRSQTLPRLHTLPMGVLHNDANDFNLLVDSGVEPTAITGLIDFGDMVHAHLINELAITAAYALMHVPQRPNAVLDGLAELTAAFNRERPLERGEIESLFSLVALRLCTSVCHAAKALRENPDNTYLQVSVEPAWQLLETLDKLNSYAVECRLLNICGLTADSGRGKSEIIHYRKQHLGKTLSLSYQEPLKIVRGQGAYLFDEKGTPYLDMVNNVCHVGHCHPKVVAAGQAQMARLNTNTRYLHDNIVSYSQRLLATMPERLSVCMLVNSGSEANELAFRLARCYTGSKELLVVDGAYHGNTNACIAASPYKFDGPGGEGAEPYIHKVTLPDPYRGQYRGNTTHSARAYADSVGDAVSRLTAEGKRPGAFICESLQGVAGQIIMPDGYLKEVYRHVRDAGGVCIADEVQVGFGRVGSHMWAFETQGVEPDIVTLGKPIGNGHPMAAVITTQEIADAFVTGMEYFNTFGGNPVSCAIGEAVLDVIEQEGLCKQALETGAYFKDKLHTLMQRFPLIGDVRGLGLFLGVELVEDRESLQPATEKTAWLVEFFKRHHILMSTEGPYYNILKIKPPLAFDKSDADRFVEVLAAGLSELTNIK